MSMIIDVRRVMLVLAAALAVSTVNHQVQAQPTTRLSAGLVPAITLNGPLGSMQMVQYSTNPADTNGWTSIAGVRMVTTNQIFYDATGTNLAHRFYRSVMVSVADTNLVWIPPGTFLMGSPETEQGRSTNEGPQTLVTLTQGFFMGRFEATSLEVITYNTNLYLLPGTNRYQLPAGIAWDEATNYCALRTAAEAPIGWIPPGWVYRLPTEAEWEYACRAGTTTPFALGNSLQNDANRQDANFDGRYPYPTNLFPVNPIIPSGAGLPMKGGQYAANGFGLFDVHGNVAEWCLDLYSSTLLPPYPGGSVTNPPPFSDAAGGFPVVRGGGFLQNSGSQCRSAQRSVFGLSTHRYNYGFRVVLSPVSY